MEKSPSLTSLEKEKSSDYGFDSTLFLQMTENFELDKEKAVAQERDRWERILEDKVRERYVFIKRFTFPCNIVFVNVSVGASYCLKRLHDV